MAGIFSEQDAPETCSTKNIKNNKNNTKIPNRFKFIKFLLIKNIDFSTSYSKDQFPNRDRS
ncbi:hypothetical protein [Limnohabitans sp. JirII-29]|uniref:hypothetical protein n=1 Tax=Limnohabitans sp. JirII-29 TaxID=1835756 RepID=UPI0011B20485|nr:hypothetical protein [Limnohabitans sp. JirII-29]